MVKYLIPALCVAAVAACAACGGGGKHYGLGDTLACLEAHNVQAVPYSAPGLPTGSGGDLAARWQGGATTTYAAFAANGGQAHAVLAQLQALGATPANVAAKGNVVYWSNGASLAGNPLAQCLA